MKPREFKLNMALPPSLNLLRLRGYIRTHDRQYRVTAKGKALRSDTRAGMRVR